MTDTLTPTRQRDDPVEDDFFAALTRADESYAVDMALGLLEQGRPAESLLLGLVGRAQSRVGAMWQTGHWSVAQEHAATCINEQVVAAIGQRTRVGGPGGPGRGHIVLACLDGEWHTLPARLVTEVLRLRGWRVTFLGASVPAEHLVSYLHLHGPDVVAVSCALPIHLPSGHRTVVAAQRTGTPLLAGGPGFGTDGRWARRLGIRAWASSAPEAADMLERLPWEADDPGCPADRAGPTAGGESGEDPRANAAEHAELRVRRGRLVERTTRTLASLGEAGGEDESALIVDFLAASVYVGDPELFAGHVSWLASLLTARGGSVDVLVEVLDGVRAELHDFPTAGACLDGGHRVLAAGTGVR